ncbi:hypothetical protein BGX24_011561 [Mortierella sp. AD032]|nr:hypothetical protein BGX24_011561 [Mortierella sp. AD032]
MPLTASQSGLEVVKGLFTDDYRSTSNSQRGRTHSNTTSVIDPSALQYASKFSNSNNNVTVSATIAGHANVSGPTNSTVAFPQGALQQLQSHHHNSTSTHAPSNSSTTTTFYSGVKLAPPVLSASVEQLGRRASDQKIWYTIQVYPCDLTIITPVVQATVSSSNAAATGGSGGTGVTSIPRKPYKIYRRYEDVADFADQLEEEFTGKVVFPSTMIGLHQGSKDSNAAASIATSTSGGVISSSGYCINGNVPGLGSMACTEKGMLDGGVSATSIGSNNNNNNTNTNTNQCNSSSASSTSTITVSLPRLKSRLVLFVTKAVCLQRKEELDRYLQELFILGPVIAQSRLVAEFFGIWKTDMEVHLSQEDRDPLALHSVAAVTAVFDSEIRDKDKDGNMDHNHQEEHDDAPEAKNGGDAAGSEEDEVLRDGRTTSAGFPVSKTTMMDSSSALRALSPSPLPPSIPSNNASFALEAEALLTYKSSSSMIDATFPFTITQLSSTAASMKNMNSTYLASPSLSPSPSAYESQDIGWTPSLSTLLPLASQTGDDVDAEMASPIEPTAPAPFELAHLDPITDGYESGGAGIETEMISDLTTRTIKKFKSLRRAHTSSHSRQQQQQQDPNGQEDARPGPPVRSSSISEPSGGGTTTVPSTSSKTKIMKRSKTIVFRPEVTMQPLSSKNVIPPWNRIPSFANSNNTGAAPISPISPTSPYVHVVYSFDTQHCR